MALVYELRHTPHYFSLLFYQARRLSRFLCVQPFKFRSCSNTTFKYKIFFASILLIPAAKRYTIPFYCWGFICVFLDIRRPFEFVT